jgi:hypothetical protein
VIRYSDVVMAAALVALSSALMGAGTLPANPSTAVTIYNPGDTDFTGYAIAVEPDGQAWSMDGAGRSQSQLPFAVTQAFFTDLAAAGPLTSLTAHPCTASRETSETNSQTDPGIYLVWRGQRSPNLQCASDPRADRLLADATSIAHAMYVQAYRVKAMVRGVGTYPYTSAAQTVGAAPSGYAPSNGGSLSTGYASTSSAASCGCGGSGFNFGIGGSPLGASPGLTPTGMGVIGGSRINNGFNSSVRLNNFVSSGSAFKNGFASGSFGKSTFSSGTFSSGTTFSGPNGSTTPNSGFNFH